MDKIQEFTDPVSFFAFKVVQDGVHLQYTSIFGSNLSEVATANGYRRSSQRVIRRSPFHLQSDQGDFRVLSQGSLLFVVLNSEFQGVEIRKNHNIFRDRVLPRKFANGQ